MPEGLNCFPDKLRLIHWNFCPLRFWPSKFSLKFLVELDMYESKFEKLWEGIQPLPCLKKMDLTCSEYLKEIPDLSNASSLEELFLSGCKSLLELTSSIRSAAELKLFLGNTSIEELPSSINTWSFLYELIIQGCKNIKEFPIVPDRIVELSLCNTSIEEVPPWIEKLFRLRLLQMYQCQKLKKISPNISKLENLEYLALSNDYSPDMGYRQQVLFYYEAKIQWGPELKRSWEFVSDFNIDNILPMCIPEKALSSPISLHFKAEDFQTIPDCIIRLLSGLRELDIVNCSTLVALPQLPGSLQSLDADGCVSLESIDSSSSFQNPNICLNFARCYNLNQEARNLIQTSACKYAFLPGEEVPAHFTHQSSSCSLTINLTPTPLPPSFRFKACILLSKVDLKDDNSFMSISYRVGGKQNGHTVPYGSDRIHHMPVLLLYPLKDHLFIFEDSFSLNQDCPESEEATFNEVFFKFRADNKAWKVKGCGVRLLEEAPQCILDGKETEEEECRGINIEANNENAGGEDKEKEDGGEGADDDGEGSEDEVDEGIDVEEDIDCNDAGLSDEGRDINIEANNETKEEGKESGCDEDVETMIRKRKRLGLGSSGDSLITMMKRMRIH